MFTVSAEDPTPTGTLVVSVTVEQGSGENFLTSTIPDDVTLTNGTGTLEVATMLDEDDEPNGTITVTIDPDPLIDDNTMDATYLLGQQDNRFNYCRR